MFQSQGQPRQQIAPTNASFTSTTARGYDNAEISFPASRDEAEDWFVNGIGRDIQFTSPGQVERWNGFVNEVQVNMGVFSARRGPLVGIANKIAVAYQTVRYNTNPPIGGQRKFTDYAEDTTSQSLFGVHQKIYSGGESTQTAAEALRDTLLTEKAYPSIDRDLNFGGGGEITVTLRCLGYAHFLDSYIYESTTTGTQDASAKITAVLNADPNSLFTVTGIDTNALAVPSQETEMMTAWSIIEKTVKLGDSSANRWLFGVFNGRQAVYKQAPTDISYETSLAGATISRHGTGTMLEPWDIEMGKWLLVRDFLTGQAIKTSPNNGANTLFIEQVTVTLPYTVSINGGVVLTSEQLLAQRGV
ncbi:MAG: hypothetical protein D6706_14425 [Chloroflexi bacterium]|nr:MAG: hypothetical protein D6706_14425 [Chloroflexota bacterium]